MSRTICWLPTWNKGREGQGLEHLLLAERVADSVVLAFDDERGPFRLTYRLTWDESWRLRDARLILATERGPDIDVHAAIERTDRTFVISPVPPTVGFEMQLSRRAVTSLQTTPIPFRTRAIS